MDNIWTTCHKLNGFTTFQQKSPFYRLSSYVIWVFRNYFARSKQTDYIVNSLANQQLLKDTSFAVLTVRKPETVVLSDSSFSSSKHEDIVDEIAIQLVKTRLREAKLEARQAWPLVPQNRARRLAVAGRVFRLRYFHDDSIYSDKDFERRFGMSCVILDRVFEALSGRDVLKNRHNALDEPGITPLARIIAALQILA